MFAQSSAEVIRSSYAELDRIVKTMTEYPEMEILPEEFSWKRTELTTKIRKLLFY